MAFQLFKRVRRANPAITAVSIPMRHTPLINTGLPLLGVFLLQFLEKGFAFLLGHVANVAYRFAVPYGSGTRPVSL
jgi:hypothetical protein